MPNVLFSYGGSELSCGMTKVDRSKLYGFTKSSVVDDDGNECRLSTLASDGRTLIGSGGTALATFSPDGLWRDKSELTPVNLDGEEVSAVPSSLKAPIALDQQASVEDYLGHNIRMAYLLGVEEELDAGLAEQLDGGAIFQFEFSYRGGISPDKGFLLRGEGGGLWMMVGKPTEIEMVGIEQAGAVVDEEEETESEGGDELLDFGMM